MAVYALAQLSFTDRAAYEKYRSRFMSVFQKFEGRLLAADEAPKVIEGRFDREKVVLLSFPDERRFRDFFNSPEYQEIAEYRKAGADTVLLLVQGIPTR